MFTRQSSDARPNPGREAAQSPTLRVMTALPPLRYLSGADVAAAMPPLPERLALAEQTLRGLAGPRGAAAEDRRPSAAAASFAHAMPAFLPGRRGGRLARTGWA